MAQTLHRFPAMRCVSLIARLSLFTVFACGGSVDGRDTGFQTPNDGDRVNNADSGVRGFVDAAEKPAARGPCTVTAATDIGQIYEYIYNEDGLEVATTFNGNPARRFEWNGLKATETVQQIINEREYIQTPRGLRVKEIRTKVGTSSEAVTKFEVDNNSNYVSAKTVENGVTIKSRKFNSNMGLVKEELVETSLGSGRYYFEHTNELIEHFKWDAGDDGSIETRRVFLRDENGRLLRSSQEILDENGNVTGTALARDYIYDGECDYVQERWYFRGFPALET